MARLVQLESKSSAEQSAAAPDPPPPTSTGPDGDDEVASLRSRLTQAETLASNLSNLLEEVRLLPCLGPPLQEALFHELEERKVGYLMFVGMQWVYFAVPDMRCEVLCFFPDRRLEPGQSCVQPRRKISDEATCTK